MKRNKPKGVYWVDCEGNAMYSGAEFTSRRKAEAHIARLRRLYPKLVRERRRFTIRWIATTEAPQ